MKNDFIGSHIVLENYLDGAMYDLENGNTENYDIIYSCILALKVLGDAKYIEYLDRYELAKKQ